MSNPGPRKPNDLHSLFKKLVPDEKVMLKIAFAEAFEFGSPKKVSRPNFAELNRKKVKNGLDLLKSSGSGQRRASTAVKKAAPFRATIEHNRNALLSSRLDDYVRQKNRCAQHLQPPSSAKSRASSNNRPTTAVSTNTFNFDEDDQATFVSSNFLSDLNSDDLLIVARKAPLLTLPARPRTTPAPRANRASEQPRKPTNQRATTATKIFESSSSDGGSSVLRTKKVVLHDPKLALNSFLTKNEIRQRHEEEEAIRLDSRATGSHYIENTLLKESIGFDSIKSKESIFPFEIDNSVTTNNSQGPTLNNGKLNLPLAAPNSAVSVSSTSASLTSFGDCPTSRSTRNEEAGSKSDERPDLKENVSRMAIEEELDSFSMKLNQMSDVAATTSNNKEGMNSYNADYHLVVDPEYKAYIRQKKKLNEQLHDHWKLELVKHPKGAQLNKVNDEMYRPNKQWLTIVNISNSDDDKQDNQNSFLKQLNDFDPTRPEDSSSHHQKTIIDTFTTSLEDLNEDDAESNTYRVSGEVGTLISQKLLSGDRIRIGRNGESVGRTSGRKDKNRHLNMIDEDANKHASRLSETSNASNYVSILSWKDQINKNDIKIIEPKAAQKKEEKKPKEQRNFIVKKLNEEEEFRPVIREKPNVHHSTSLKHSTRENSSTAVKPPEVTRRPVEIVGFSPSPHPASAITRPKSSDLIEHKNVLPRPDPLSEPVVFNLDKTLVPARPARSGIKPGSNLTERNYLQIIENLTNKFSPQFSQDQDSSEEFSTSSKNFKDKSVNLSNPNLLGNETGRISSEKTVLRSLEKKYRTIIENDLIKFDPSSSALSHTGGGVTMSHPSSSISTTHKEISPSVFFPNRPASSSIPHRNKLFKWQQDLSSHDHGSGIRITSSVRNDNFGSQKEAKEFYQKQPSLKSTAPVNKKTDFLHLAKGLSPVVRTASTTSGAGLNSNCSSNRNTRRLSSAASSRKSQLALPTIQNESKEDSTAGKAIETEAENQVSVVIPS